MWYFITVALGDKYRQVHLPTRLPSACHLLPGRGLAEPRAASTGMWGPCKQDLTCPSPPLLQLTGWFHGILSSFGGRHKGCEGREGLRHWEEMVLEPNAREYKQGPSVPTCAPGQSLRERRKRERETNLERGYQGGSREELWSEGRGRPCRL